MYFPLNSLIKIIIVLLGENLKNQPAKPTKQNISSWGRDLEKKNSNQRNQTNQPKPKPSNLHSKYRNLKKTLRNSNSIHIVMCLMTLIMFL